MFCKKKNKSQIADFLFLIKLDTTDNPTYNRYIDYDLNKFKYILMEVIYE